MTNEKTKYSQIIYVSYSWCGSNEIDFINLRDLDLKYLHVKNNEDLKKSDNINKLTRTIQYEDIIFSRII